jgi:copper(I)-binding protein
MNHPRTSRRRLVAALALVALVAAACGDDDATGTTTSTTAEGGDTAELTVSDVWARPATDLSATDRSAVYMVLTGGAEDDALLSASVPTEVAAVTEVHETVTEPAAGMDGSGMGDSGMGDSGMGDSGMDGGMMQMREVDRVEVPAGATVRLEPGGYHVMLLELAQPLTPGDTFEVTLEFEVAGQRTVTAEVREP